MLPALVAFPLTLHQIGHNLGEGLMATDQERAVFNDQMAPWQARLDRYQVTKDPQLILDPHVIAGVMELKYAAPGSTSWESAEHLCAWYHWLRYEVLGDGRGEADRQAAEQLFRSHYSLRPADLPESLRRRYDTEFRQLFASVMAQVDEQTRRRRPDRRKCQELLMELGKICNFTARSDPQYFDRLEARAHVAQLARDPDARSYQDDVRRARAETGHQPPPANPPWQPFDYTTYFHS
jgi:hypothetical protein